MNFKTKVSAYALLLASRIDENGIYHSPNVCDAGGFQTQVNVQPAPAVEGDWASANPRFFFNAGQGGMVCGAGGVTVGRFAWASYETSDNDNAPATVNNFGAGAVSGIIHREQQALITAYLADATMVVPLGFGITVCTGGDLWVRNNGAGEALIGQKAYANTVTGQVSFAATGSATNGGSATGSIAASTFSVTGSIAGNVMTVSAVGSGVVVAGATISGTNVATSTKVVKQLSGAAGGIGTYALNIPEQTAASTTISGTYGTFTAASALTGAFTLGGILTGTGISVPTYITQFLTGTGGLGTYVVDVNTVVASATLSEASNVETKWFATSSGANGELVKISSHALG